MKIAYLSLTIGVVLIVMSVIGGVDELSDPSDILRLTLSTVVYNLMLLGMGTYLIFRFTQRKQEETKHAEVIPDSSEDIEILQQNQNRIFGYVIFVGFISSIEIWFLNDYSAGLTTMNMEMVFDLAANLILAFFALQCFKNKDVSKPLLYVMTAYAVGTAIFEWLKDEWVGTIVTIMFVSYFAVAIIRPLNRKNYRISHLIVLPVVFLTSFALITFDSAAIDKKWEENVKAEQEYLEYNHAASVAYSVFLENEHPTPTDIEDVRKKLEAAVGKVDGVRRSLITLEEEYGTHLVTEYQIITLEILELNHQYYDAIVSQGDVAMEFMDYAQSLDFSNLNDEERARISAYRIEVEDYNQVLTTLESDISEKYRDME